jgi:5-methylcytosine-specific restriction endonuclease McrA
VEHIIPVHLFLELGLENEAQNDEENFELLCYTCNKFKGGRIDMAHSKTISLLKKYIDIL